MTTLLTIGDFSRMTHLSVKALRHYHDLGVLEPAVIDPSTGYRSYTASQVPTAQVIRRLRDLNMPLDQIRSVLTAPDIGTRNAEIAAHLRRMEVQLEQTQASVAALRALLAGPAVPAARSAIELRTIPAVTALAVREVVNASDAALWGADVFSGLLAVLEATGLAAAGPPGALFPGDFFELERSELTVFLPVGFRSDGSGLPGQSGSGGASLPGLPAGQVRWQQIPGAEAAVMVHEGAPDDVDRTYGALGTVVAERAIGVEGPIREYYLVSSFDTDDEREHRTEVCWPVFRTGGK